MTICSVVVVAFDEKLIVYDACRFRERFTITGILWHCNVMMLFGSLYLSVIMSCSLNFLPVSVIGLD